MSQEHNAEEWVHNLEVLEVGKLDERLGLSSEHYDSPNPETLPSEVRQKVYYLLGEKKKKKTESDAAQDPNRSNGIKENPFYLLKVSTLDSRTRILDQVQSRSLVIDEALCQKAASTLTNPRTRLSAEIGWFTGIDPEMSLRLMREIERDLLLCSHSLGLDSYSLTKGNLISAAMEQYNPTEYLELVITQRIMRLCQVSKSLKAESIMKSINMDREKAGFTLVQNESWVEEEIENRRKHYKKVLTACIDRMPTEMMIRAMTSLATTYFQGDDATPLFNELIDSYELGAHSFLNREFENVEKLIEAIKKGVEAQWHGVQPLVTQLDKVLKNWCRVARPIQVNMNQRGLVHRHADTLGWTTRRLSLDICNNNDAYNIGKQLTSMLIKAFDQHIELSARLQEDAKMLDKILSQRDSR